ncbi:MAG TPA: GNAT family N-acetyltransferase, partial [Terriglobales bacterium]
VSDSSLAQLVRLMREFYAVEKLSFHEEVATFALRKMLLDPGLGSAYLVLLEKEVVGYFVLTYCFSLEFHGKFALLDELYIREAYRKQKLGKSVVEFCEEVCKKMGIKTLRLEVSQENAVAQKLYYGMGFKQEPRLLFTRWM